MRKNDARRTALVDAAIEVLASAGARGLTFRAVDAEAGVPNGTASNYFTSRDDLFTQIGGRVYDRLLPDEATVAGTLEGPRTPERYTEIMRDLVDRVTAFGSGQLALLELRLESTRRPELQRVLTARIRRDIDENQANHIASGLPGDEQSVLILYLALNWLILERLTLPDLLRTSEVDAVVEELVRRALAV
ncbi:TetR family transcriptional regulator [Gordonia sp. PDNC005]|uniref:TetR/AcrR family transcriptional regulator n=1 Tax=unclassified Gordonia (in: high G+C Gram-positive bacteria) TaxID=2657482 RepID=UPI001965A496|nr:TetR family transcriptional regulator [Gordonia sp. PDNC005]QRY61308.1 TetR family transcriptional regulator [Gordonia sp. PDNC005]